MIFVTLGNVPIPFLRLAEKAEELAVTSGEDVIVQFGHTEYPFRKAIGYRFLSASAMAEFIDRAAIVITHGGYGTMAECIRKGKRIIAVPRRESEHNHSQEELVRALEEEGYVVGVYDMEDLTMKVEKAAFFKPRSIGANTAGAAINEFILAALPNGKHKQT